MLLDACISGSSNIGIKTFWSASRSGDDCHLRLKGGVKLVSVWANIDGNMREMLCIIPVECKVSDPNVFLGDDNSVIVEHLRTEIRPFVKVGLEDVVK